MKTLKEKIIELKEEIKSDFDTGGITDYWDIDYYFDNDSNDENLYNILKEFIEEILNEIKKVRKDNSILTDYERLDIINLMIKQNSGFEDV